MSLNIDDDKQQEEAGRPERPARQEQAARAPERQESTGTMRNMGRSLSRALSRTNAGEALTKAYNAFDKLFHDQAMSNTNSGDVVQLDQYKVVAFDHQQQRVDMSSLIFIYPIDDKGQLHVFYYTLLVEGSTPQLAAVRCDDRGRQFEIPRVAGDVLNARYADRVYEVALATYGDKAIYHDCGTNVLPSDIDVEKDETVVRNLAFYINAAIETISVEILEYQPKFTLKWLERDDSLEVAMDWSGEQQFSATGQPRRTDVKITITSNVRDETGVYRDHLTRVGGSLEVMYAPDEAASGNGFSSRQVENPEIYVPLYTMTDVDSDFKAITLEMQLLGMASTAALSDDLTWVNSFRPVMSKGKDERDYRDIGALNYLTAKGAKAVDVKSSSVETQDFLRYFGSLCRRDLAYAIDVDERGDNTWINQVFVEAAQGSEASLKRIFNAANNLTDGLFEHIYREMAEDSRSSNNPFEDSRNRILLGWYKEDGEKHDLRKLDVLYWLNRCGEHDSEMALDWQDTYDRISDPVEVRLEKRLRLLENVFGASGFKVTGYAQKVYINSVFIAALAAAVKACGVQIDQSNTTSTYGSARVRGNFQLGRLAGKDLGNGLFGRTSRRDDRDNRGGRFYAGRGR